MLEFFSDEDMFCGACGVPIAFYDYKCYPHMFEDPEHIWYRFYRVIIVDHAQDDDSNPGFMLSGIAALPSGHVQQQLCVPTGANEIDEAAHHAGYIGTIASNTRIVYPARYWSSQNCENYPHGYPFHAKCWILVEHRLQLGEGQGQVTQHLLESLIVAIRKYWYGNNYDLDKYWPIRRYMHPWIPFVCYSHRRLESSLIFWPHLTNPVDIPEINKLIKQNKQRRSIRMKEAEYVRTCQHTYFSMVPIDLHIRILDFLNDVDARSYSSILGWSIPESYWRQRLAGLIFELKDVGQDFYINWEALYFATQKYVNEIEGLDNRQRIWKALTSIKKILQSLGNGEEQESAACLSVFVKKTYPIYTGPIDPGLKVWKEHFACERRFPTSTFFGRGHSPSDLLCECEILLDETKHRVN